LDTYLDALQGFPDNCDNIQVAKGNAMLIKKDIFKNLMWYVLPDTNKQYPVTIERVRKIKSLNTQGVIPEELEAVEITSKAKEAEPEFVELVGQISLQSLERADKKRKQKQQQPRQQRQQPPQQRGQQQKGQQQRGPQQNPNRPPQGGPQRGPNRPPQQPRRDK